MDLGYFKRSRARLICWMGIPPLLIILVLGSAYIYTVHTDKVLADRQSYLQFIPQMEAEIDDGKAALNQVWDEGSSVDSLNTALNRYASDYGLIVNNLSTSEYRPRRVTPQSKKLETTEFKLTARGSLLSLMKFCHDIQNEQPVLSLNKATVNFTQMDPTPQYQIELIMHHHKVKI